VNTSIASSNSQALRPEDRGVCEALGTDVHPECPRCGYDLTGELRRWQAVDLQSCPAEGLCSECGLEFRWGDVLEPGLMRVDGFAEDATSWCQWWTWAARTWLWCWWPPSFWSRVRLEHRARLWRALAWLVLPWLALHALGSGALAVLWMYSSRAGWSSLGQYFLQACADPFAQLRISLASPWWLDWPRVDWWQPLVSNWSWWVLPMLASALALGCSLMLMRGWRRELRVETSHVIRAVTYWLGAIWMVWILRLSIPCFLMTSALLAGRKGLDSTWQMLERIDGLRAFLFFLVIPWSLIWLWSTLSIGWRVKHAGKTMIWLLVPALLAGAMTVSAQAIWLEIWWPGAF